MRYHNPKTVTAPKDFVDNVRVQYDGGPNSVSVAIIEFEGVDCFAMRWNVARREWGDPDKISLTKVCMGIPTSRSHPVWFILPGIDTIGDFIDTLKSNVHLLKKETSN